MESVLKRAESQQQVMEKQQALLNKSLAVTTQHFEIVQKQREAEERRLAQKPQFEFVIGEIPEVEIRKRGTIIVPLSPRGTVEFSVGRQGCLPLLYYSGLGLLWTS